MANLFPILITLIWAGSILFANSNSNQNTVTNTQPPKRIVSLNIATDEILLDLVEPGRIAALSTFSTDPNLSFRSEDSKKIPLHITSSIEQIEMARPDFLIITPFSNPNILIKYARSRNIPFYLYKHPNDLNSLINNILYLETKLKGRELSSEIDIKFREELNRHSHMRRVNVLIIHSFLNAVGRKLLFNSIVDLAGFTNAIKKEGIINLSMEKFFSLDFELIITTKIIAEQMMSDKILKEHPVISQKKFLIVSEKSIDCINHNIISAFDEILKAPWQIK